LENAAGAGGTVGRNFDELATVIDATRGDKRLGICLDTQHLFASGVAFKTFEEADAVVRKASDAFGLHRLHLIHLNDSKAAFGANRDRHENLGDGEIGAEALGTLISHPSLVGIACVLEVPGDGKGPRAQDIAGARHILEDGYSRRSSAR
jgi:deoxyribonuclease-4